MKQLMRKGIIFNRFLNMQMYFAAAIIGGIMLLICTDVFLRYALNNPLGWTHEIAELMLVWIVSLGMAWLLREEGHIRVDILTSGLKPRTRALFNAVTSALSAMAVLIITWYGLQRTLSAIQQGYEQSYSTLHLSIGWFLIPLVIGCLLFSIQFMERSYAFFQSWKQ